MMSKVNARSHSPGFGVIMRQVRCRAHMSVPRCSEIQEAKDNFLPLRNFSFTGGDSKENHM